MTTEYEQRDKQLRDTALIIHLLNVAAAVNGITAIVALIIALLKRDEARGTMWEGHFTYAIRTFFLGLIIFVVSMALTIVVVGIFGLLLVGIWWLVRSVLALIKAINNEPIRDPETWLA